jgi:hypothetical protein
MAIDLRSVVRVRPRDRREGSTVIISGTFHSSLSEGLHEWTNCRLGIQRGHSLRLPANPYRARSPTCLQVPSPGRMVRVRMSYHRRPHRCIWALKIVTLRRRERQNLFRQKGHLANIQKVDKRRPQPFLHNSRWRSAHDLTPQTVAILWRERGHRYRVVSTVRSG